MTLTDRRPPPCRRARARRCAILLSACLAGALALPAVAADGFPSRPIRLIVPFAAGGTADIAARLVADAMGQGLRQPVVVENKPGAGGTLGTSLLMNEPADGYAIGLGSVSTHATSVSLYRNLKYDPRRDFVGIGMIAEIPSVLVVGASLGVDSVAGLVERARRAPDSLNFGSIGNGTSQHLGGELFKLQTGTRMTHVPYKQNAQLVGDLVAGRIQMVIDNLPNVQQHVQQGSLKALAVTTAQRATALPDVPTMIELGFPDFAISSWVALYAPRGTPADRVERLGAELRSALERPALRERLMTAGMNIRPLDGPQLATFMDAEIARWARVVEVSGARVD